MSSCNITSGGTITLSGQLNMTSGSMQTDLLILHLEVIVFTFVVPLVVITTII